MRLAAVIGDVYGHGKGATNFVILVLHFYLEAGLLVLFDLNI